jgi:ParB-like chromosome segregation protein Spo0J
MEKQKEAAAQNAQSNVASSYKREVKTVNVNDLMVHPKLESIYSPTDREQTHILLSNIKERGLINKIIVTSKLEIISGKRRWGVIKRLATVHPKDSWETIEVEVVDIPEEDVLEFGISANQQRIKTWRDQLNEFNRLFDLYSPGQGVKAGKGKSSDTNALIERITGAPQSRIDKLRSIDKHAPHLIKGMDDKGKSLSAAYNEAMMYKRMRQIAEQEGTKFKSLRQDEKLTERFTKEVTSFLEKKSPKHASLVKEGRLSAKDAYEEVVNRADRKDRKDPKCECPYCNSSIEHKTLLKIATLKPEEVNQMLTKLREGEMMDIAS